MSSNYIPSIGTILCFCIEIETSSKFCCKSEHDHFEACEAITTFNGNPVKKGDLVVIRRIFSLDDSVSGTFDFDTVHHLPLSPKVYTTPIVVEMVYMEGIDKCFARVKNDLMCYDGVTALHVAFEVLEYLEHTNADALSPYPFKDRNLSKGNIPGSNWGNFFVQLGCLLWMTIKTLFTWNYWKGHFVRGPLQAFQEDKLLTRPCFRFSNPPKSFKFKDFIALMDNLKADLGIEKCAITLNFSPKIALAILPDIRKLSSKEKILDHITLPPVGVGEPSPMNGAHVAMLSNTVFFNNYGRHNINISGKVVDFVWDWSGFLKSFPPLFFAIEIQGNSFYRVCVPSPYLNLFANKFVNLGSVKHFIGRPFIDQRAGCYSSPVY